MGKERAGLLDLFDGIHPKERFVIPAALCTPSQPIFGCEGVALRVYFALLWMSSRELPIGQAAIFRASLAHLRIASGFESYQKNAPVLSGLGALSDLHCTLPDETGTAIFARIGILEDGSTVEWVFSPGFAEIFIEPPSFAIVSVQEMAFLKSPLDFFLYLQIRRIWAMYNRSITLPIDDICQIAGMGCDMPFKRVTERVKRSVSRIACVLDGSIVVSSARSAGSARHDALRIDIAS